MDIKDLQYLFCIRPILEFWLEGSEFPINLPDTVKGKTFQAVPWFKK